MSDIKVGDIVKAKDLPQGASFRYVGSTVHHNTLPRVIDHVVVVSLPATAQERLAEHLQTMSDATGNSPGWCKEVSQVARYLRDHPEVLDLLDEVEQ